MLKDIACEKAKPGPKSVKLSDAHGLYLYVAPTGLKSWRYNYRHQGKQQTIVLGAYPSMSLLDARIEHNRMRELVKPGANPADERRRTQLVRLDAAPCRPRVRAVRQGPAALHRQAADCH